MEKLSLVIMAAGLGSRFGGLKQTADIDGRGHRLMDYSVFDGVQAGFRHIVFIINRNIERDFRLVSDKYPEKYGITVDYAFQETDRLPSRFSCPRGRTKPWGTAHAVACLKDKVNTPFALINADDLYGRGAYVKMAEHLREGKSENAMIGYRLRNTLSKSGGVSRGICNVKSGSLLDITETYGIIEQGGEIKSDDGRILDGESIVSMNFWGFAPEIISECESRFSSFLKENVTKDLQKCEFCLPTVVSQLIREQKAAVSVLDCDCVWQGMTYREDISELSALLAKLVKRGEYPENF